jgi:hypothetical protein
MDGQHDATDQWTTYEGNVQAYRGLALSAQGLFLAVGAILLGTESLVPLVAVLCLSMLATWWVFFPVIFARTAIVDFHKFHLGRRFDRSGNPATAATTDFLREKEYARVTDRDLRRKVYDALTEEERREPGVAAPAFRTMRQTRLKLDLVMPAMFTVTWVIFVAYAFGT